MSGYGMDSKGLIEGFIDEHVTGKGLDDRTEKAYRLDLEHFCVWMSQRQGYTPGVKEDNGDKGDNAE